MGFHGRQWFINYIDWDFTHIPPLNNLFSTPGVGLICRFQKCFAAASTAPVQQQEIDRLRVQKAFAADSGLCQKGFQQMIKRPVVLFSRDIFVKDSLAR